MTIEELIQKIQPVNRETKEECDRRWDHLAKPLGSLGVLEDAISKMAALREGQYFSLQNPALLVFCADNGVVAQNVSQSDASVTTAVARALGERSSTVNYLAEEAGCRVTPINIGMKEPTSIKGVVNMCIRRSTGDISCGPAMTRQECERAILSGADAARAEARRGTDVLLLGEMGIGNTTTSTAVACALLKENPETLTGKGAGLSPEGLIRKKTVIAKALEVNAPNPKDPIEILTKVGGLDLAALCGACLGGAAERIPVVLDGVITCVAALCAVRLCPDSAGALIASHESSEPAAKLLLQEMNLAAPIHANLRLGEGSGAVLSLPLYRQTLTLYNSGHTFEHLGIEAYRKM